MTLATSSCSNLNHTSGSEPELSKYIYSQFLNGENLAIFGSDKGDLGATMEAIIQLRGSGFEMSKFAKSKKWLLSRVDLLTSQDLMGLFLVTAKTLNFIDSPEAKRVKTKLIESVDQDIAHLNLSVYQRSWAVLGLVAAGDKKTANVKATEICSLISSTGGFKINLNDSTATDTADVTGLSILALVSTLGLGNNEDESLKTLTISRAKAWLVTQSINKTYWLGYGNYDVSGTAYAAMALVSGGEDVAASIDWLKTLKVKGEGLKSANSDPNTDVFATLESLLILNNKTFLDVLKN
jgi:hypothetical protein